MINSRQGERSDEERCEGCLHAQYKLEAVRLVKNGQSMAATAKVLGIAEQTLHNWSRPIVKASWVGRAPSL